MTTLELNESIAEVRESLIADLIYARTRRTLAKTEMDFKYFDEMTIGIEGAIKALGIIDIELAIVNYDLKYDM